MAQAFQIQTNPSSQNLENRSRIRAVTTPVETVEAPAENLEEVFVEKLDISPVLITVGDRVRHTRFLNTNGPSGTYVLEISDNKALCQYVDTFNKTRQVWFMVRDLIHAY